MKKLRAIPTAVDGADDSSAPEIDQEPLNFPDQNIPDPVTPLGFPDSPSQLSQVHEDVSHLEPDHAAKVFTLSDQLQAPEPLVDKDLKTAELKAKAPQDSLFDQIEAKYPGTTQFLKDPKNMAVTKDDLPNMADHEGLIDWIKGAGRSAKEALESGALQEELGFLGYSQMTGELNNSSDAFRSGRFVSDAENITDSDPAKRASRIEQRLLELEQSKPQGTGAYNLVKRGLYGTLSFAPQVAGAVGYGAKDAAKGIAAGASLGALAGSPGLIPGAIAGATAGGTIGAGVGFAAGEIEYNYKFMAGLAYNDLKKIKDTDGNPLPDNVARIAAMATGAAASGLSLVKLDAVMGPAGKAFLNKFMAETSQKVLDNPATQKLALTNFAKNYAENWAHFTGAMTAISGINIAGREAAKFTASNDGSDGSKPQTFEQESPGQIFGELGNATFDAALTGGFATLPGAGFQLHQDLAQAKIAQNAKDFTLALGDLGNANKLKKRMGPKYADFVNQLAKDGPVENIHIPVEALKEYFQSKNIDPEAVAGELGVTESYQEAEKVGGDVKIPLGTWAEKIVGTEHANGLADDVKYHPDDLTLREVTERKAQVEQDLKDLSENTGEISSSADKVAQDVEQKLLNAGQTPEQAKAGAELYRGFWGTTAAKVGRDPFELYQERGLQIRGEQGQGPGESGHVPSWPGDEVPRGTGLDQEPLWKKEGYTFQVTPGKDHAPGNMNFTTVTAHDSLGNQVGRTEISEQDGHAEAHGTSVDQDHQRKGLATEMYSQYESATGHTLFPDSEQTPEAKALWNQPNRPFGNKSFNQSAAQQLSPAVSPLGFYSALSHEVQKMDFKDMPAKDLAGRIKNLSGVKAEELEHTGIMDWLKAKDGKVTKAEVQEFLKNEGVKVEQVVLSEDFKSPYESDVAAETDWQAPERDHSSYNNEIENEIENYTSDDFWNEDRTKELRDELLPDHTDEEGNVDETALDAAMEEAKQARAENYATESVEDEDYHSARYIVRDDATGYTLHGSDEMGWWSPELGDHIDGNLEEAKVQLLQHMIAEGVIEGNVADHIKPKDIEWKSGTAAIAPSKKMITQRTNALIKSDHARLLELSKERNSFYVDDDGQLKESYTQDEYNKYVQDDIKLIAEYEVIASFEDHTNKKNQVQFSIKHSLIHGNITGNDHSGYTFEIHGKEEKTRGGGKAKAVQDFPLTAKTIDEAKAEAVQILIEQKKITPEKAEIKEGETAPDVNEPTGRTKYSKYVEPGGENYREVLLTLPAEPGAKTFKSSHFDQKNILAHVRLSDRVDEKGRKTLFLEELQSDWHQAGRERGYEKPNAQADAAELRELLETYDTINFSDYIKQKHPDVSAAESKKMFAERTGAQFEAWQKEHDDIMEKRREIVSQIDALESGVADAPFKNTESWAGLALKRMLTMAVEQGYEAVAWTPAKTHVDRWGTDNVSWVKKVPAAEDFKVVQKDGTIGIENSTGRLLTNEKSGGILHFTSDEAAHNYIAREKLLEPHWLVGSAEQRGGNADGVNIEELARARGELLERKGEKVTTKEELKKVIAETLGREREDRSLDSLTDSVWKQMQESDSGVKSPRKEGMEFFYDNMLPRKVAPAVLKKLDPSAKVEVTKFDTGENDLNAVREYSGPEYDIDQLTERLLHDDFESVRDRAVLKNVLTEMRSGQSFKKAMGTDGNDAIARHLGGELSEMPKKAFESWEIPITEAMKEKIKLGQSLFQGEDGNARGRIRFGKGLTVIDLFKTADKSTFAHESAHLFLEVVGDLSNDPNASEQLKKDYQSVLDYLGVKSRDQIETAHHELFAKTWEAYLMQGETPSPKLQGAFSRMRQWLTDLYKNISTLGVTVTPEIKAVFDRMLATDKEISEAEGLVGLDETPLSDAPAETQKKIKDLQEQARELAVNTLLKPQMAELKKERRDFIAAERERLTLEAEKEVNAAPLYQAIDDIKEKIKKKNIVDLATKFLDGTLKPEEATHFEVSAELHDFADGKDLAKQIINDSSNEQKAEKIKNIVDLGMAPHADLMNTEQIKIEALKAVHNDKMTELLALEHSTLLDLAHQKEVRSEVSLRKRNEARIDVAAAKEQAESILGNKTLRESGDFRVYVTAERNAAVKVAKALARKDYEAAATAKRQQMLAHQMVSTALKNREEITKALKYFKTWTKRGRDLKDMPYGFTRQIDRLLERFGLKDKGSEDTQTFIKIADKMLAEGQDEQEIAHLTGLRRDGKTWSPETTADFLARVNDNYYALHIPDSILNGAYSSYKDIKFSDIRDLKGAVQALSDTGKAFNRFLSMFEKIDITQAAKELRASVEENVGAKYKERKSIGTSSGSKIQDLVRMFKDLPDGFIPSLVNMATLTHYLDGGKIEGPANKYIYRPLKEAENRKFARYQKMVKEVDALFSAHYTPKEFAEFSKQRTYQEAFARYMTKEEIIALALNWGNEGNRDRIRRGYNLDDAAIMHVLSTLEKKDFDFVQSVFNHLETYWPEIKALEMKINGVEPTQVKPARIDTQHGSYAGGYYPISYDFEKSTDAFKNAEQKNELFRQFSAAAAHTDNGHAQERVSTVSRPVRLNMDVFANHLENVVHDLEFRAAIVDVARFLNQTDTKGALENAIGIRGYKGIGDWLKATASDQSLNLSAGERAFQWTRFASTLSILGARPMALILHLPGNILNSAWEVGAGRTTSILSNALMDTVMGKGELKKFVFEKSEMMNQRLEVRDRDIMDMSKKWKGTAKQISHYAFMMLHWADEAVSVPLWADVYKAHVEEKGEARAKAIADETIVRTLGSGSPVDRIGAQRGSELKKLTTMFYSWMSVMFNRAWADGKIAGLAYDKGNTGEAVAILAKATFFAWLMPAAYEALVRETYSNRQDPGSDEEKQKRFAGHFFSLPFAYVPLVRDVVPPLIKKAMGERGMDSYQMSPVEGAINDLIVPAGKAVNIAFSSKQADEKFAEDVARATALVTGYPQQLNTWAFNLLDYSKGQGQASYKDFLSRRTQH